MITERHTGGAAAWLCIFFIVECALLIGCSTAAIRRAYDEAGRWVPAEQPAEKPAEPSGDVASTNGAPPSADTPSPAAPAVTVSGLRLTPEGRPDWTDARWQDAILKDDVYYWQGRQQLPPPVSATANQNQKGK